ncbi:EF-hand domain-containing protein [Streptomyces tsukubensis]|uniref:Calcium-binding protein n=1 Tax=Streptomyces tsukubensis TaxID=83656 RepID=A0A1V3ZYZ5_9ACTN|nr:EF-hand domain-containing protein [Streptomyces tsukubensis]OON71439.1 calcium-binding protein [Streptomyces tsukubensis]QFR91735.1 calcium-binding protein [Streptomyces tsukubensis]QFR91748.1 calcium-binding protein [Streptomyces tsukubensis]QFR97392.1 calcium-binding protein [Streptomyces tsukubensis]
MTSAVKSQKFNTLFDWFDQDRDGQLTQGDMQAMAGLFAALAQGERESATAMRDAFERWWQLLLTHGDTDGDGRVSRDEFIAAMEANVTSPENFGSAVLAIADATMQALDTDGDGVLSREEYVSMASRLSVSPVNSAAGFQKLDRDGDGVISHEEYRTALSEFFLSADLDAPGNWLLGPIDSAA